MFQLSSFIDSKNYNSRFTDTTVLRHNKTLNCGMVHTSQITFPIFATTLPQHDILSRKLGAYQKTHVFREAAMHTPHPGRSSYLDV